MQVKPAESILISTPLGLDELGAKFTVDAPFAACRICGAIYQSDIDRKTLDYLRAGYLYEVSGRWYGHSVAINALDDAHERRQRWRQLHERRYHTDSEIEALLKTGMAFTPEAAHRLAPYGIAPMGNMHEEVVDAMATAPRAPINDVEGA